MQIKKTTLNYKGFYIYSAYVQFKTINNSIIVQQKNKNTTEFPKN